MKKASAKKQPYLDLRAVLTQENLCQYLVAVDSSDWMRENGFNVSACHVTGFLLDRGFDYVNWLDKHYVEVYWRGSIQIMQTPLWLNKYLARTMKELRGFGKAADCIEILDEVCRPEKA
jgi:hypothetical protein